jgi:DNA-binding CsgD family transcriptional regulator
MSRLHLAGLVAKPPRHSGWVISDPRVRWAIAGHEQLALFPDGYRTVDDDGYDKLQASSPSLWRSLTPRQQQIVARVLQGVSDAEIAAQLGISRSAVSSAMARVRRALDVGSRDDALARLSAARD